MQLLGLTRDEVYSILGESSLSDKDKNLIVDLIEQNNRAIENELATRAVAAVEEKIKNDNRTRF